jgi:hypothetical protein
MTGKGADNSKGNSSGFVIDVKEVMQRYNDLINRVNKNVLELV